MSWYYRPRLLDLCCCAGSAAMGYHNAGFDVVGVDIAPQPNYPFEFVQMDALEFLYNYGGDGWDAIHASPPCQKYSVMGNLHRHNGYDEKHPDMIAAMRERLEWWGIPWVIENVPGAPLENPIMLCGSMFGLRVYRHRLFESSFLMLAPPHVPHKDDTPSSGRGKSSKGYVCVSGSGGVQGVPYAYLCEAMGGVDWMNKRELSQAIPPAYTEFVGRQLLQHIEHVKQTEITRMEPNL
jgi:DNA (cytosine-5)-methyltransferase 1